MIGMLLGLALAFLAGVLAVGWLWPGRARPGALVLALAWPAGLALTSSAYFLWLVVTDGRAAGYPWIEALLLASLAAARHRRAARTRTLWPGRPGSRAELFALTLLVLAVAAALACALRIASSSPWGYWDAWARINLKARFLFEGGSQWTWVFHGPNVPHHDYPLLLECSVARLWRWSALAGRTPFQALEPQVLGLASWCACLAALLAWVAHLRSTALAVVAGLAFLCKESGSRWAALQYADLLLATYFVCGAGALAQAVHRRALAPRAWPLLGFLAGAAAWCKNEGAAFALLLLALVLISAPAQSLGRAWRRLAAGLALGGAALLVLKLGFASASSVFGSRARPPWWDLLDASRYRELGAFLASHLRADTLGWALLLLLLAAFLAPRGRARGPTWPPLVLCGSLALVFALVLLTTREDLVWHLGTAGDRLVLQLWPLAILGAAGAVRSP